MKYTYFINIRKKVTLKMVFIIFLFMCSLSVNAQKTEGALLPATTLTIRFRLDSVRIDMLFAHNDSAWRQFEQDVKRRFAGVPASQLRLDIFSGASPEGTAAHNRWLGENRGQAIRRLVSQRLPGRIGSMVVHNEAARWEAFYESVARSQEPWRDEVLRIIELPPSQDEFQWDHRERKLRALRGGSVWPVLLERYLAPLRSGATAVLTWQLNTLVLRDTTFLMGPDGLGYPGATGNPSRPGGYGPYPNGSYPNGSYPNGSYPNGLYPYVPYPYGYYPYGLYPNRPYFPFIPGLYSPFPCCPGRSGNLVFADPLGDLRRVGDSTRVSKPVVRRPVWILSTNLPLLGTGTPNLKAEWSLGHRDRWSLNVQGIWSWWVLAHNAYANEIMFGSVELRRFLGRRSRHHTLDGWHIGLALGVGYYDLEWKSYGYQGEVAMGFLNIGWQKRFGRRKQWAFDVGVGLGDLYTQYRRYWGSSKFPVGHEERYDDHLMWKHTSHTNWIGAPHANISVGYCISTRRGARRRTQALQRDSLRDARRDSILAERQRYIHFRDSLIALERDSILAERQRYQHFRDSLRAAWSQMPKAQRKAARREVLKAP